MWRRTAAPNSLKSQLCIDDFWWLSFYDFKSWNSYFIFATQMDPIILSCLQRITIYLLLEMEKEISAKNKIEMKNDRTHTTRLNFFSIDICSSLLLYIFYTKIVLKLINRSIESIIIEWFWTIKHSLFRLYLSTVQWLLGWVQRQPPRLQPHQILQRAIHFLA